MCLPIVLFPSSHVIPAEVCALAGIYGCGFCLSFSLEKKRTNFAQAERRAELAQAMLRQSKISEAKSLASSRT